MGRVHVAAGIFQQRLDADGANHNGLREIEAAYRATGGAFIVHARPTELWPRLWFTDPIPPPNAERSWRPGLWLATADGRIEDTVPEDSALLFDTPAGTVSLTGCGHAGIVNIAEYATQVVGAQPLLAVIGGLDLFVATGAARSWTASR